MFYFRAIFRLIKQEKVVISLNPPLYEYTSHISCQKLGTDLIINSATKLSNYDAHQSKFVYLLHVTVDTGEVESRSHYISVFTTQFEP